MQSTNVVEMPTAGQSSEVATLAPSGAALILDGQSMDSMMRMGELMAASVVSVPAHLRGKPSDCLAIVMQSIQWRMNPFAVAQKTHLTQGGALGYEAQLINAVITTLAPIKHRPTFEFFGDWKKILGKVEERKSDKGGKYYVSTWDKKDEEGLGVRCAVTFKGEVEPRIVEILLVQCWPRFSTQWATDPQQQICYAVVRKLGRRYTPDVILGVYTPEELEEIPHGERDMGAADVVPEAKPDIASRVRQATGHEPTPPAAEKAPTLDAVLREIKAAKSSEDLAKAAEKCAKLVNDDDKATARAEYKTKFDALKAAAAGPTFAEIEAQIQAAESVAAVNAAQDLIRSIKDDSQREELGELAAKKIDALTPV